MQGVKPGQMTGSDTVYLCVIDSQGNACSFVNSTYMAFGTGLVPNDCGFSLQVCVRVHVNHCIDWLYKTSVFKTFYDAVLHVTVQTGMNMFSLCLCKYRMSVMLNFL